MGQQQWPRWVVSIAVLLRYGMSAIHRQMAAGIAPHSATSVAAKELAVTVVPDAEGYVLRVRYHLAADPDDRRPLWLDLRYCQFPPERIEVDGQVLVGPPPGSTAIRRLHVRVERIDRAGWQDATIDVILRWPNRAHGRRHAFAAALVIPDSVPRLLHAPPLPSRGMVDRPVVRVELPRVVSGIRLAGIASRDEAVHEGSSLLEAVLVKDDRAASRVAPVVTLTPELEAELSPGEREHARSVIGSALEHLGETLGRPADIRVVVKGEWERLGRSSFPGAASSSFDRVALGLARSGEPPDWFGIGVQLARAWWSGGVRIGGASGRDLEAGIALALGVRLLRAAEGAAPAEAAATRLRELVSRSRGIRGFISKAKTGFRYPVAGNVALALVDAFTTSDTAALAALRSIIRDAWGRAIGQEDVACRLREAGVAIPPLE